ncbi:hypothetical protein EDC01DRAFT_611970 [Geopyxis carbonaria]|nr:hypothetical protein EDC01DRAFT_611970 [Geopyxis carbonaria]
MATANVEKTRSRLEKRIEEGSYYEAHQQLRVVSQRYVKARKFDAAIEILCAGAHALLKAGQSASGGDLCLLLVDVYKAANLEPSHTSKSRLLELAMAISPTEPSRKRFIGECVAWSAKYGPYPAGDPELHHLVGNMYAQDKEVYEAEKHLILGNKQSGEILASLLYDWYTQDQPHTAAMYISRAVLPYLLIGNTREAFRSMEVFTDQLVRDSPGLVVQRVQSGMLDLRILPSLPLINFLTLLVVGVRTGGSDNFRTLRSHYSSKLREVTIWDDALEQIGEIYFGVQVRRPHNILDMMGNLFGGQPTGASSRAISDEADFD